MAVLKCKMCGADLVPVQDSTVCACEYCGTMQTIPTVDNEKKMMLFARANRLRFACEFDKAFGVYEAIVAEFSEEAEAYWGLILCKYGIEYVDDPTTGKKIPTCHRSSFDRVMDDPNFELVMEYSDSVARKVYREEAKFIEELRKSIIEVSGKEEPYDIFICYKETAEDGERTLDSVLAQDVYDALADKGYRVFFSRITLEDKLGQEYEPYIFAALNSAKVMLAFGTDYEYYNAVWVKNEWSRYLKLMAQDKNKHLIPCFKGIDAYDMPKEFAKLQAQDMGKVGAVQDLLRGIEKLIGGKPGDAGMPVQPGGSSGPGVESLLRRGQLFLEDGDWRSADEYFDKVLDIAPECAEAYLGKLMAQLRYKDTAALAASRVEMFEDKNYIKAYRFGSAPLKGLLEKVRFDYFEEKYIAACKVMDESNSYAAYERAAALFHEISDFKDSAEKGKRCKDKMAEITSENSRKMNSKDAEIAALRKEKEELSAHKKADMDSISKRIEELQRRIDGTSVFSRKERSSLSAELEGLYSARNKMVAEYTAANLSISEKIYRAESQYRDLVNELDLLMNKKPSAVQVDRSADTMICPLCGVRQKSTRKVCFTCGVSFVD